MKSNKAFTLIELLVVVLIIGILTAIAVPKYQKAVGKSRLSTIKNLIQSVANAEEAYYLANDKYTTDFNDLDITKPNDISCIVWDENNGGAVACEVYIGPTKARYYYYLNTGANSNSTHIIHCACFSMDKTDVCHQVCQNDSGQTAQQAICNTSGGYCYYTKYR